MPGLDRFGRLGRGAVGMHLRVEASGVNDRDVRGDDYVPRGQRPIFRLRSTGIALLDIEHPRRLEELTPASRNGLGEGQQVLPRAELGLPIKADGTGDWKGN